MAGEPTLWHDGRPGHPVCPVCPAGGSLGFLSSIFRLRMHRSVSGSLPALSSRRTSRFARGLALCALGAVLPGAFAATASSEHHAEGPVFGEADGVVAVEAEAFFKQERTDVRAWYLVTEDHTPEVAPDPDPSHVEGASGGAYLEVLPDTRTSHDDELKRGENFTNKPGDVAVLHYRVKVDTPGRWYVWARIYSTNSEDNSLHVGLNGEWPDSGQRMQWTAKNHWVWGAKQRTNENHEGVPHLLYLDIEEPGEHIISFSMREDGADFDKWMMTQEQLEAVEGVGPAVHVVEP